VKIEDQRPTEDTMRHGIDGQREASLLDRRLVAGGITWWGVWAGVAFVIGALFRLIRLDAYALTPNEGLFAFQGWAVYRGEGEYGLGGVPDTSPAVQLAEATMFFIAGATDVVARLAPVAAGIGILALVFLLRPVTRPSARTGLLLTLGLSPSLVHFSRLVDPAIFIAFFTMLLVVAVARAGVTHSDNRLLVWAAVSGIALGGMVASGPNGISALLTAVIAIAISIVAASSQERPDALGVGARRLIGTPSATLVLLGVAIATVLILFTRLFSDIDAIAGVIDSVEEWGRIVGTRPTTTPTQFFLWATLLYELVSVALLLVALLASPVTPSRGGTPVLRASTLAIWFGTALVLLSLSSGREPEQLALVTLPLTLAAGLGLGYLIERVERYRLLSSFASLVTISVLAITIGVIAILMMVARANDPGALSGENTASSIIMILLLGIVPFSLILARAMSHGNDPRRVSWAALLVLVGILGVFGVRGASMLAWERSDGGTEMLAQETSTRGVVAFVDQVTRLSRDLTVGDPTLADPTARFGLTISIAPEVADPYRWYFRDFPDVSVSTAAGWTGSDVVIAPDSEAMAETGFIVHTRAQFNRVPPAYEGLETDSIVSYIFSPSKWYDGIRFLLFRDTIAEPPPQQVAIGYTPELSNQINPAMGPFNLADSPGRGSALGQFDTPIGVGSTSDGEVIYVVDSVNLRILRFTGEGEFIGAWNAETDPNLSFAAAFNTGPTGMTVSEDDLVYVADTWNHRVVVIDRSGKFVREIGQRGGQVDLNDNPDPTQETGLFFGPRGVVVHDGEIFVTDTGNERVQVFATDGTFLRAFGGFGTEPGKLIEPVGIAVTDDGMVYVADSGNDRVSVFERDGTPVTQIPIESWQGQAPPLNYIAYGSDGLVYLTSPSAGVIDVLDPETNQVILTSTGPVDTPFEQPMGIAVMPNGDVLVSDIGLHDIIRFRPEIPGRSEPATPAATPATPRTETEPATPEPVG
jgi:DNA-binding beta-propeller fold protein YncE